jgi:hypothetical protein
MGVLPGHRRDLPQQQDGLLIAGSLVPLQQGREQDGIIGDNSVRDQPAALVGDRDIEVGMSDQLLLAANLAPTNERYFFVA